MRRVWIILILFFSLGVCGTQAEGLGPGIRLSALWSGGEEGPGGEAALFFQKPFWTELLLHSAGDTGLSLMDFRMTKRACVCPGRSFLPRGKPSFLRFCR